MTLRSANSRIKLMPRVRHDHGNWTIFKVRGSKLRYRCGHCPYVDPWWDRNPNWNPKGRLKPAQRVAQVSADSGKRGKTYFAPLEREQENYDRSGWNSPLGKATIADMDAMILDDIDTSAVPNDWNPDDYAGAGGEQHPYPAKLEISDRFSPRDTGPLDATFAERLDDTNCYETEADDDPATADGYPTDVDLREDLLGKGVKIIENATLHSVSIDADGTTGGFEVVSPAETLKQPEITLEKLVKMQKKQLQTVATTFGCSYTNKDTKDKLIKMILDAQKANQ